MCIKYEPPGILKLKLLCATVGWMKGLQQRNQNTESIQRLDLNSKETFTGILFLSLCSTILYCHTKLVFFLESDYSWETFTVISKKLQLAEI